MKPIMPGKIVALHVLLLILFATLTGCLPHIDDTNGNDDFRLQAITDRQIVTGMDTKSTLYSGTNSDNKATLKINKFSGVKELLSKSVNNETLTFSINCSVTSGNFRGVIVKDGEIIQDFDINGESVVSFPDATGTYIVKVAGESAKFRISIVSITS